MSNTPRNFAEATNLAAVSANRYITALAGARFSDLKHEMAKRNVDFAIEHGFSQDYIDAAQAELQAAIIEQYECNLHLEKFDDMIKVWSSCTSYDDQGLEYNYVVGYSPRGFCYMVARCDESGSDCNFYGNFASKEEAIAHVLDCDLADEGQGEFSAPSVSKEESDAAGNHTVVLSGKTSTIKQTVDEILNNAYKGCGLHYEIYARRAKAMLDRLIARLSDATKSEAIKYLEYDRY